MMKNKVSCLAKYDTYIYVCDYIIIKHKNQFHVNELSLLIYVMYCKNVE